MDTMYFTRYLAHQDDYRTLLRQSAHARLVEQATATQPIHPVTFPIHSTISAALIAVGEWLRPQTAATLSTMSRHATNSSY